MASVPSHVTPLRLVRPATVDLTRALHLLSDRAAGWLGTPVPAARPGFRRYVTDLSLPIRNHAPSLVFRKAAFVDLGPARETPEGFELEIGWQSASLAPLFPVYAGHLTVTHRELRLEGFYAPPGGELEQSWTRPSSASLPGARPAGSWSGRPRRSRPPAARPNPGRRAPANPDPLSGSAEARLRCPPPGRWPRWPRRSRAT